jgi:hypothetical protein
LGFLTIPAPVSGFVLDFSYLNFLFDFVWICLI